MALSERQEKQARRVLATNPSLRDQYSARASALTLQDSINSILEEKPPNSDRNAMLQGLRALSAAERDMGILTVESIRHWYESDGSDDFKEQLRSVNAYLDKKGGDSAALIASAAKTLCGYNVSDAMSNCWKEFREEVYSKFISGSNNKSDVASKIEQRTSELVDENKKIVQQNLEEAKERALQSSQDEAKKKQDIAKRLTSEYPTLKSGSANIIDCSSDEAFLSTCGEYLQSKFNSLDHSALVPFVRNMYQSNQIDFIVGKSGELKIPQFNSEGQIANMETITCTDKKPVTGAQFNGTFSVIGDLSKVQEKGVIVTEGFYTGVVVKAISSEDFETPVLISRVNGNLHHALGAFCEFYENQTGLKVPNAIYAGDNDIHTFKTKTNVKHTFYLKSPEIRAVLMDHNPDAKFNYLHPRIMHPVGVNQNGLFKKTDFADMSIGMAHKVYSETLKTPRKYQQTAKDSHDMILGTLYNLYKIKSKPSASDGIPRAVIEKTPFVPPEKPCEYPISVVTGNKRVFIPKDPIQKFLFARTSAIRPGAENVWVMPKAIHNEKGFIDGKNLPYLEGNYRGDTFTQKISSWHQESVVKLPVSKSMVQFKQDGQTRLSMASPQKIDALTKGKIPFRTVQQYDSSSFYNANDLGTTFFKKNDISFPEKERPLSDRSIVDKLLSTKITPQNRAAFNIVLYTKMINDGAEFTGQDFEMSLEEIASSMNNLSSMRSEDFVSLMQEMDLYIDNKIDKIMETDYENDSSISGGP